jgi:TfoX/Sxy family transcriptional regulator of competence genes
VTTKKRQMPKWTKAPPSLVDLFGHAIESLPGVQPKKMFGYPAAFVNGNMFSSLFQSSMILRLSEQDRTACASRFGARLFEPMPGRPMREYIEVPERMLKSPNLLDTWLRKARDYAAALPHKTARRAAKALARKR